jgi:predicted nucleic acid-binding protein
MKDKSFLDTNIFVYAIDTSEEGAIKGKKARSIIRECIEYKNGVISTQVIQEFFVVSTRKIKKKLSVDQALEFLRYISVLEIIYPDEHMIFAAARKLNKHQISFWDAMIIQSATAAGCSVLLSEDLQHGSEINGIRIFNPFA